MGRIALVPAVVLLLARLLRAYAISLRLLPNPLASTNLPYKTSAQLPSPDGTPATTPASQPVVVFLLWARNNHPLGILAPGWKTVGETLASMITALDTHAETFGFLGMTHWNSANDVAVGSGALYVCYFRDVAGLHAFAHSPHHRTPWDWWNRHHRELRHISIAHESYAVPRGAWESVYINSPLEGLNSTVHKVPDSEGEDRWMYPVVDASSGMLKTANGRMNRSDGDEHDVYG